MKTCKFITPSVALIAILTATAGLQGCAVVAAGGAGAAVATDRRSAGTMVDDEAIELKVNNALFSDDELNKKTHINVTSINGVILLTGEAPTAALHDRVIGITRNVEKVRRVHDEIAIAQPTTMKSRSQDTWITAKIKTKLLGNKEVSSSNVKVVTENGSVYLMGLVTRAEAETAAEVARHVEGVSRVVTVFEYQD